MNHLIKIVGFLTLALAIYSCNSEPIKIVFEAKQQDTATELYEPKIYQLKKHTINSDFNYSKLKNIDRYLKDTINLMNTMLIFEPIKGRFDYYQFLATYKGQGYNAGAPVTIKDFHDILIIKTDKNNRIIDAFQYTLDWAEPPLQYDLFKSSENGFILGDSLDIKEFKFIRTDYWSKDNKELKEEGTIRLKK